MVTTQDYYSLIQTAWFKTEDVYEDFSKDKEMFDFNNYSGKSKYYEDSNNLVLVKWKMKKLVLVLKN